VTFGPSRKRDSRRGGPGRNPSGHTKAFPTLSDQPQRLGIFGLRFGANRARIVLNLG
jgi:hypothetical protein